MLTLASTPLRLELHPCRVERTVHRVSLRGGCFTVSNNVRFEFRDFSGARFEREDGASPLTLELHLHLSSARSCTRNFICRSCKLTSAAYIDSTLRLNF